MRRIPLGFLRKAFFAAGLAVNVCSIGSTQDLVQPCPDISLATPHERRSLSFKIARDVAADGQVEYYDDQVHTVTYWRQGAYDPVGLQEINSLLRDRAGSVSTAQCIDAHLIDLLFEIKTALMPRHPDLDLVFHVISASRDPKTNQSLRTDKNNPYRSAVGDHSMHTHAKAIDIFIPEVRGEELRDIAWHLQQGGVGWYPQFKDMFPYRYIHVDTGPVRHWGF